MDIVLVFFVGVLTSFYGAMVGGGGLVTIPFLIFMGLPPQVAIATNKLGSIGQLGSAFVKYARSGKVQWKLIAPFLVIAVFTGVVGARILLSINEALLSRIIAVVLLGILILVITKKKIGLEHREVGKVRKSIGYVCYTLSMTWGSFFGGGFGVFVSYTLIYLFGLTMNESAATSKFPSFIMGIVASVVYALSGVIHYPYAISIFCGMILGGYFGAGFALKKGDGVVKSVFVVVVVASAIKLLLS
ncbi:sulfite exporter TauE/SafE family protein [Candidatus Parcubacteria bacterium]|jgi:uncharacterized protein|nr:sulfite exporter TauE/SafE family protein [Candidatus Parcubacteria bacterium]MBT3949245.1 sulfite exporter TauE/SafE family protein [Candidatus Parcubacteria bacterium]